KDARPSTRDSGLGGDFVDSTAGEPEDAVLRHRQAERPGAGHAGVKAAQDPGHHTMTDDDDRTTRLLRQPAGNAPGESLVRLAVDSVEIPLELLEIGAHPGTNLAAVEPVPGAERNLAQPIVEAQRRGVSQALGDD